MIWTYIICAAVCLAAFAMFSEVIVLIALVGLGYQVVLWVQTGVWPSYTLGQQLGIQQSFEPTQWVMVDRLLRWVLFDLQTAFVVISCAGFAMLAKEWLQENTRSQRPKVRPPAGQPPTLSQHVNPAVFRQSLSPPISLPTPTLGIVGRFGVFLGWLFNAAAIISGVLAMIVFFSGGETGIGVALLLIGVGVWLFGRGLRYVFVGPVAAPSLDA